MHRGIVLRWPPKIICIAVTTTVRTVHGFCDIVKHYGINSAMLATIVAAENENCIFSYGAVKLFDT